MMSLLPQGTSFVEILTAQTALFFQCEGVILLPCTLNVVNFGLP